MISDCHDGAILSESASSKVVDCIACGFAHVIPLPTPEALAARYEDYPVSPAYLSRTTEDLSWWRMWFKWRLDRLAAIANAAEGARRVLDVGSSLGFFLETAERGGWEAIGVEPSKSRCAHARNLGCHVVDGSLDDAMQQHQLGRFDGIHASEVLEHVRDPAAMMRGMWTLLRPGGAACIVVPNDFNPVQRIVVSSERIAEWWVAPEHHLNYFTHRSLAALAVRSGFEVMDLTSTFPIDFFLLMGDRYIGNDALGRACHQKRMTMELAVGAHGGFPWYEQLSRAFAGLGLGREAVLWARRPEN